MSLLTRSPKVDTQISLQSPTHGSTFYGDDKISGTATFALKKNYEDVHYRVQAKGIVSTKIDDYPAGSLNHTSKFEDFTFLSASLFDGSANPSSTPSGTYQTQLPFKFSLQKFNEQLKSTYRPGGLAASLQQLVPTLDSRDAKRSLKDSFKTTPNFEYRIRYHVVASAYVERKRVSLEYKGFEYVPTSEPGPPIATEDFPDEYILRATEIPKRSRSIERIGVVSEEPTAISLSPSEQGSEGTEIKLLFMLIGNGGNLTLPSQCHIKATLRTTTFVMPRMAHPAMHTQSAIAKMREGVAKTEKTFQQEFTMSLRRQWQSPESDSDDDEKKSSGGEEVHTASLGFPFKVDAKGGLAPGFYSPLLSRRYAIDVSVELEGMEGMKLRLPVQILYEEGP